MGLCQRWVKLSMLDFLPETGLGGEMKSASKSPYKEGDMAILNCDAGFTLPFTHISRVVSTQAGELRWDPSSLNCNPISCGQPPIPDHGNTSHKSYVFPKFFSYECEEGYRINQSLNKFFCGVRGEWTPTIRNVSCDPVQCPSLATPPNGRIQVAGNGFFESVTVFSCDPPFVMVRGEPERICQANGQWSGEDVECGTMTCPALDPRVAILASNSSFKIIDCGGGKTVAIKCLNTGKWSKDYPYCPPAPTIEPPVETPTLKPPVQTPTLKPPVEPPTLNPPVESPTFKPPVESPTLKSPVQTSTIKPLVQTPTPVPPVDPPTPPVQTSTIKPPTPPVQTPFSVSLILNLIGIILILLTTWILNIFFSAQH